MNKWFENPEADRSVIISSRIRLARNLSKYPFSALIDDKDSSAMIKETVSSIKNERTALAALFSFVDLEEIPSLDKYAMLEKHIISPWLLNSKKPKALLVQDDETISIMLNEEDHIRIQSIFAGENIDKAWDLADKIDNLIEETLEYAFDKDFGYLTSCPTNTGTGMRGSYMVHLPMLEKSGQLKNLIQTLGKFGITIRGIYGEGSESQGGVYQISNQLTLGKSEQEIIEALKNLTNQIIESEKMLCQKALAHQKIELMDSVYRSYGILTNCRKLSVSEAMSLLSSVRLGYSLEILDAPPPSINIYSIMMNIHPASLQKNLGRSCSEAEAAVGRADYIRGLFN